MVGKLLHQSPSTDYSATSHPDDGAYNWCLSSQATDLLLQKPYTRCVLMETCCTGPKTVEDQTSAGRWCNLLQCLAAAIQPPVALQTSKAFLGIDRCPLAALLMVTSYELRARSGLGFYGCFRADAVQESAAPPAQHGRVGGRVACAVGRQPSIALLRRDNAVFHLKASFKREVIRVVKLDFPDTRRCSSSFALGFMEIRCSQCEPA